jgi:hypothetical protein
MRSDKFKKLLATDASTIEGQDFIAGYYGINNWVQLEEKGGKDGLIQDKRHRGHVGMQMSKTTTQEELLQMLREKERMIKKLQGEIDCVKNKSQPRKRTLRQIMKWSGEENLCPSFLISAVQIPQGRMAELPAT